MHVKLIGLIIIAVAFLGLYFGVWVMIIGGIIQIFDSIKRIFIRK